MQQFCLNAILTAKGMKQWFCSHTTTESIEPAPVLRNSQCEVLTLRLRGKPPRQLLLYDITSSIHNTKTKHVVPQFCILSEMLSCPCCSTYDPKVKPRLRMPEKIGGGGSFSLKDSASATTPRTDRDTFNLNPQHTLKRDNHTMGFPKT